MSYTCELWTRNRNRSKSSHAGAQGTAQDVDGARKRAAGTARPIPLLLAALTLIVLALWGCASRQSAEALVRDRCTRCHTLAPIEARPRSPQEWESVVYRMIQLGAKLNDRDALRAVEYLATNYGTPQH